MDTTPAEAAQVIALLEAGHNQSEVARRLNLSRYSVRRVYQRFQETGGYIRRPGSGRRRTTSERDDRFLVTRSLRNRQLNAVQLGQQLREVRNVSISRWTVRRRLGEAGMTSHRPANGPKLTTAHRQARLQFAREHLNWTYDQWRAVMFSDECRMTLHGHDGRSRVYRRSSERFSQCCISERVAFGGGSCMFWGGIMLDTKTDIVFITTANTGPRSRSLTAARYVEEVLEEHVRPLAWLMGEDFLLMHDNARPHVARTVCDYMEDVGITAMEWPARSPDLNPIEHVWDELKRRVRARSPAPTRLQELQLAIEEEWNAIPQDFMVKLIRSMKNRLRAVIKARGGNTPY